MTVFAETAFHRKRQSASARQVFPAILTLPLQGGRSYPHPCLAGKRPEAESG